ncbi:hypothetical protein ACHAQH_008252 [Verticillium albo-atrum]
MSNHSLVISIAWTLVTLATLATAQSSPLCAFLRPVFPRPADPASEPAILYAVAQLNSSLEGHGANGTFDSLETTLFISVFGKGQTFLDYGYAPPSMEGKLTASVLDENTIFRIGIVSKLVTVYSLLAKVGMELLNDPVTKWVPELVLTLKPNDAVKA